MPSTITRALFALLALGFGVHAASAQTVYGDAGRPDPKLAPYGLEAHRAVEQLCLPDVRASARGHVRPGEVLEQAGARLEPAPPQWVQDGARDLQGGARVFASVPGSDGRLWIASLPGGATCRVIAIDGLPRGRMFTSADAAFRDGGWRLRRRVRDSLDYTERTYEHLRPGRSPDAVLELKEFVYGGGPTRRLRLLLTVQGYK